MTEYSKKILDHSLTVSKSMQNMKTDRKVQLITFLSILALLISVIGYSFLKTEEKVERTETLVEYVMGESNLNTLDNPAAAFADDLKGHLAINDNLDDFNGLSGAYRGLNDSLSVPPFVESDLCTECGPLSQSFKNLIDGNEEVDSSFSSPIHYGLLPSLALGSIMGSLLLSVFRFLKLGRMIPNDLYPVVFSKNNPEISKIDTIILRSIFLRNNPYEREMLYRSSAHGISLPDAIWEAHRNEAYHIDDYVALYSRIVDRVDGKVFETDNMKELKDELKNELDSFDVSLFELES